MGTLVNVPRLLVKQLLHFRISFLIRTFLYLFSFFVLVLLVLVFIFILFILVFFVPVFFVAVVISSGVSCGEVVHFSLCVTIVVCWCVLIVIVIGSGKLFEVTDPSAELPHEHVTIHESVRG